MKWFLIAAMLATVPACIQEDEEKKTHEEWLEEMNEEFEAAFETFYEEADTDFQQEMGEMRWIAKEACQDIVNCEEALELDPTLDSLTEILEDLLGKGCEQLLQEAQYYEGDGTLDTRIGECLLGAAYNAATESYYTCDELMYEIYINPEYGPYGEDGESGGCLLPLLWEEIERLEGEAQN